MRRISEFIQVINQERHVRLFHLVFHEFTKVKDYTSVFNVVRHLMIRMTAIGHGSTFSMSFATGMLRIEKSS